MHRARGRDLVAARDRVMLALRRSDHGFSYRAIAAACGVSVRTAWVGVRRAEASERRGNDP